MVEEVKERLRRAVQRSRTGSMVSKGMSKTMETMEEYLTDCL